MSITDPNRPLPGEIEPWRCDSCEQLMFNVDGAGLPIPGAPMPHFWDTTHRMVCTVCYDMAIAAFVLPHFRAAHDEWKQEEAKNKERKDRLSGKRDYFTGA